jgi:hypothetical protein
MPKVSIEDEWKYHTGENIRNKSVRSSQKGISLSRGQFCKFCKNVKPRISFDFNRLLFWAFAKLNPVLLFGFWSIRSAKATETPKISVLIFDFCSCMGGPKVCADALI